LRGAKFIGVDIRGTIFKGANLEGTDFSEAKAGKTPFLTLKNLTIASCLAIFFNALNS